MVVVVVSLFVTFCFRETQLKEQKSVSSDPNKSKMLQFLFLVDFIYFIQTHAHTTKFKTFSLALRVHLKSSALVCALSECDYLTDFHLMRCKSQEEKHRAAAAAVAAVITTTTTIKSQVIYI